MEEVGSVEIKRQIAPKRRTCKRGWTLFSLKEGAIPQGLKKRGRSDQASPRVACLPGLAWLHMYKVQYFQCFRQNIECPLVSVTKSRARCQIVTRDCALFTFLLLCSALVPGILQRQTGKRGKHAGSGGRWACRVRQARAERCVRMQVLEEDTADTSERVRNIENMLPTGGYVGEGGSLSLGHS